MSAKMDDKTQPIGEPLPGWTPRQRPPATAMSGRYCVVEPLNLEAHGDALFEVLCAPEASSGWTYQRDEQPKDRDAFQAWLAANVASQDPMFHAVVDRESGKAVGLASFMRMDPANGVIEVGHIHYAPIMRRTRAGTEAMFLMMQRAFGELGYRRYEWKCDSLNAPSRRAAERYGFTFEGIFRQALIYKKRNRDTAWFAIIDRDWPAIKRAFEQWLDPANFDASGRQKRQLSDFR
jgi:RimJ/RimL family protein N-acetyltransferase